MPCASNWGGTTCLDRRQYPPGEDEQVLAAFDRVLKAHPSALLILVPRHPERFDRVAELCAPTVACGARRAVRSARGQDLPG